MGLFKFEYKCVDIICTEVINKGLERGIFYKTFNIITYIIGKCIFVVYMSYIHTNITIYS